MSCCKYKETWFGWSMELVKEWIGIVGTGVDTFWEFDMQVCLSLKF